MTEQDKGEACPEYGRTGICARKVVEKFGRTGTVYNISCDYAWCHFYTVDGHVAGWRTPLVRPRTENSN